MRNWPSNKISKLQIEIGDKRKVRVEGEHDARNSESLRMAHIFRRLDNTMETNVKLTSQVEKRKSELLQIQSLDQKISSQLAQLSQKSQQYGDEIGQKYSRVEAMKVY
jgi:hypothetical protein